MLYLSYLYLSYVFVRPKASEVLLHPLFWNAKERMQFLWVASLRAHGKDEKASVIAEALKVCSPKAFQDCSMDSEFINEMKPFDKDCVLDFLRIIQITETYYHYNSPPVNIQVRF